MKLTVTLRDGQIITYRNAGRVRHTLHGIKFRYGDMQQYYGYVNHTHLVTYELETE